MFRICKQKLPTRGRNRQSQTKPSKNIPSRELTYPLDKAYLKMIFLFPRWDMLVPWRVCISIWPILGANFIVIELRIFCLSSNAQLCSSFVSRVHKTGPTSSYSIPIPATRCLTVFRLIILSYEIHSVFQITWKQGMETQISGE